MSRGALSEADGQAFFGLLDRIRFLADTITQKYRFNSVAEVSELRRTRPDVATALGASAFSYWHLAPAGECVFPMLMEWLGQDLDTTAPMRHLNQQLGGRAWSQGTQQATALRTLAQNEASQWATQRVSGFFYYVRDADDGCALCVTEDLKIVYKVFFPTTPKRISIYPYSQWVAPEHCFAEGQPAPNPNRRREVLALANTR